jgi:molecular chaperone GrpE
MNSEDIVQDEKTPEHHQEILNTSSESQEINSAPTQQEEQDLMAQLNHAEENYKRALADNENLRRRHTEELSQAHKYAINKFAQELLSVKDSLEMALADQSGQFENLKFGVDLTLKQLSSAFEKAHIQEIAPTIADKLDPHLHQAIGVENHDEIPTQHVIRVMQKGYILNERILRPAMVIASKGLENS